MATNFPTSLDTPTNPSAGNALNSPSHSSQHTNTNDAIVALEAKVGVNSSAVTTSHDYKLSEVTSTDKAVGKTTTQTLTNKTLTAPQINMNSDATGDMLYRASSGSTTRLPIGTSGQILNVDGTGIPAWVANPSAANASTTVKGVVEIATTAEITAGTATGSTGAALAISPDQLLTSSYSPNIQLTAGESINSGQSVYLGYYQTGSAITHDNSSDFRDTWTGTSTNISRSFTVGNNSNRYLVIAAATDFSAGGPGTITSMSYGGTPMTQVQTDTTGTYSYLFILANPSTGANNITYTVTSGGGGNSGVSNMCVYSYYNVSGNLSSSKVITAKTSITGAWDTYGNAQVFGFKGGATSGTTVTCAVCPNNSYQSQVNRLAYYSGSSAVTDITASGSISFGFTGGNLSSWDVIYTIALTPQNTATAGYLKLTTASNTVPYSSDRWTKFIGISKSTVTATQTTNVQVVKEVTGLSGLTSNSIIYLSDTSGTLSTSAGSNSKKVGIATSTTSLLLKDTI